MSEIILAANIGRELPLVLWIFLFLMYMYPNYMNPIENATVNCHRSAAILQSHCPLMNYSTIFANFPHTHLLVSNRTPKNIYHIFIENYLRIKWRSRKTTTTTIAPKAGCCTMYLTHSRDHADPTIISTAA